MLVLGIDTAGPACAVALLRGGECAEAVLARASEPLARGHAERLLPMVEAALGEAGIDFPALQRIAVTVGPGSFTGVRVGIAAARGLALALAIPAVGVRSLEALALPVTTARTEGTLVAVLDARRDEVYARATDLATGALVVEDRALSVTALAALLDGADAPLILVGAGAPLLASALGGRAFEIAATPDVPDIIDVARLALASDASRPPVPLYARKPDAKPQAGKSIARR